MPEEDLLVTELSQRDGVRRRNAVKVIFMLLHLSKIIVPLEHHNTIIFYSRATYKKIETHFLLHNKLQFQLLKRLFLKWSHFPSPTPISSDVQIHILQPPRLGKGSTSS